MAKEEYRSLLEKRHVDGDGNTPMQESTIDLPQHLQYSKAHVIEQVDTIMIIHNPLNVKVALISNVQVPMPSPTKATSITCITPKGNLTISCKTCDVALEKMLQHAPKESFELVISPNANWELIFPCTNHTRRCTHGNYRNLIIKFMTQRKPSLFKDRSCLSWEDMSIDANVIIVQQHNQYDKG
jgi:hypothetical protein